MRIANTRCGCQNGNPDAGIAQLNDLRQCDWLGEISGDCFTISAMLSDLVVQGWGALCQCHDWGFVTARQLTNEPSGGNTRDCQSESISLIWPPGAQLKVDVTGK